MNKLASLALLAVALFASPTTLRGGQNLIRNGSFEGALLYWHDQRGKEIVEGGKNGTLALRINDGWTMSAPFVAEREAAYTVSFWARAMEGEARVSVSMPPTARETAVRAKRLWSKEAGQGAKLTTEWQRLSFSWKADVPRDGFWPLPHYAVVFSAGEKGRPILIDGVTVVKGGEGTADYIPRRVVEVVADCANLPGYEGAKGNIFEKGATAEMAGHVSNPGDAKREIKLRWQLIDYEGTRPLAAPMEKKVTLDAGETQSFAASLPLTATGTVIARFSALDEAGEVIDSSDFPLTSLPYEKHATKPDYRERFGGSFAGGVGCLEKMQRIGFGWSRWWPSGKWHNFEPKEGVFDWQDKKFEEAFQRGISCHVVLYGWPDWNMDKEHPLPRDMRWKADDPRWDDLSIETTWDKFVNAAALHFKGKPVIFQIANEPGHDKWKNGFIDEYVQFNVRTARLLKQTDPACKVSINNVYTNPSPPNSAILRANAFQDIDVWSWHDYHAGWLLDATGVKRMRNMLDGAGGKDLEIWFTEGWAFTNTLVDEPIACTSLGSVESTHAIMDSMAELAANGHDKTVMFHLMYETHGMSFWDYSGPGTMLWDWYSYPLPLVGAWNVLNHHIGLSEAAGFVRPPGGNLCVFQDLRNDRGVIFAYADRRAKKDAVVELPVAGLQAEDIMGNAVAIEGNKLILSKTGRPVVLFTGKGGTGKALYAALESLDRGHLGFVSESAAGKDYRVPETWEGTKAGTSDGNPVMNQEQSIWRLDRLYPGDRILPQNYTPMVWGNQAWIAPDHTHGGHPSASMKDGGVNFGTMGPWNGAMNFRKQAALVFIVPESGVYHLEGTARSKPWEGTAKTAHLYIMKRDEQRVGEVKKYDLPRDNSPVAIDLELDLAAGHELLFLPEMPHANNSTNILLEGITVTRK